MQAMQSRRPTPAARRILLAAPFLLATLLGCDGDKAVGPHPSFSGAGNGPNGKNATVRITPANDTLDALNDAVQLSANVPVAWTSLTPSVTTVDPTGRVLAVGPGLGLIEALANRKADTARVLVRQILRAVQVTPDSISVGLGPLFTATLTAVPADANGYPISGLPVTWTSDATAVATVLDGVVTGVAVGTTTVRATTAGVTGTAKVVVEDIPMPYP